MQKKLYKAFILFRSHEFKLKYKSYKNKLTSILKLSEKAYYSTLFDKQRNNLSIFDYMGKGQENCMFLSTIDDQEIISIVQNFKSKYGFRSNMSTSRALLEVITTYLGNNKYAIGIFVDLRKAFDTVNHDILTLWYSWYSTYIDFKLHSK